MTVGELILELVAYDPDTDIVVWDSCSEEGFTTFRVDADEFDSGEIGIVFNR